MSLGDGLLCEGRVSFAGAAIGGSLNCAGGTFRNRAADGSAIALDCRDAEISGSAVLANGFRSEGMVSFPEAKIGGTLNCIKGVFVNHTIDGKGKALSFEYAQIEDGVYLKDGFLAEGEVRFYGSRIKANFECNGGRFNNPVFFDGGSGVAWNNALSLGQGNHRWRPLAGAARGRCSFEGRICWFGKPGGMSRARDRRSPKLLAA